MTRLVRDDLGFVRTAGFGRISRQEIEESLGGLSPGEALYRSGVERGVRTGSVVTEGEVDARPGDTFSPGPLVLKASPPSPALQAEWRALSSAGFGGVEAPRATAEGWRIRLRGLALPGGVRTDALVLLPASYPLAAPIGFYLRPGAATGGLDPAHLYGRTWHGAPAVQVDGEAWLWFCSLAQGWIPGRHTLVTYLAMVLAAFRDRAVS